MPISIKPTENDAVKIAKNWLQGEIISCVRLATGNQNHVYEINTDNEGFVLRLTTQENKSHFKSGLYCQTKLIPLGVPVVPFIEMDIENKYSIFPSVLMKKIPGSDICNIYAQLSHKDKKSLAQDIYDIQTLTKNLPLGTGYGRASSYEQNNLMPTWYDFIEDNINFFKEKIASKKIFPLEKLNLLWELTKEMKNELNTVKPTFFLRDISERNVIIHKGKISGLVDIDDVCFGDPLLVIALTEVALEQMGYDNIYTRTWLDKLSLSQAQKMRFNYYLLFYIACIIKSFGQTTFNGQLIKNDIEKLELMLNKHSQFFK